MAASTATDDQQTGTLSRWVPILPAITLQQLNPFASNDEAKPVSKHSTAKPTTKRPVLSTFLASEGPPSPSRSSASVMFAEPDANSNSTDSREGSIDDQKRKKSQRRKTSFSVCHPPPASTTRQKLHRRPRSLLQLHRLSASNRPVPAFEVIPSANFSVKLTRAITKVFGTRHGLCTSDLVVMKAEKYVSVDEEVEEEEAHVIGLICKGKREKDESTTGKAKVYMRNGQEWEAYPLMNGGYEFFATDEHGLGLTVRWVPKKGSKGKETKRFNFSTISPNSRRHPVIASLSKTSLEVYDTYKMPDPSVTPLSTPRTDSQCALQDAMEDEGVREQCETDDVLREIITMTGIYVTFREGWSPSFKYEEKGHVRSASGVSSSVKTTPSVNSPPGSPQMAVHKRNSVKSVGSSIFRRSASLMAGNRMSQGSLDEAVEMRRSTSVRARGDSTSVRARGDSTSTVLVHRAASNRRKAATWRPDLLDAKHQLNETSREDLNGRREEWEMNPDRRTSMLAEPLIEDTSGALNGANAESVESAESAESAESDAMKSERSVSDATTQKVPEVVALHPVDQQVKRRKRFWRAISLCGRIKN
ncbi:hypothetical protein EJ03DRAFT_331353 [Teratosphaeria nubilosa]|uniref:Uncharacterized protein n=1 Tax=Teratosphaeria nubilosa TaxID=161662 RepID=A0A6G1KX81_9PEZI|nr:hypothetical protein EJ03DRAFT_331353 [Teratosphaeria nubilosa]